ncbi:MAG TPA: hypothetical protein VMH81_05635 [Bryobacteraceae bacterium]|nr:hypothetical protein [Bryobacteraceae bacterium]
MVFRAVVIAGVAEGSMAAWTPAAPASACDAISIPEVADVLGESVSSRGALINKAELSACSFVTEQGTRISIVVRRSVGPDWKNIQLGRMRSASTLRPVPGLGEGAFLYENRKGAAVLCVLHSTLYVQVSVVRAGNSLESQAPAEQLSRRILMERREVPA